MPHRFEDGVLFTDEDTTPVLDLGLHCRDGVIHIQDVAEVDQGAQLGYVAGTPGDWIAPPPTTVQTAIDRIRAFPLEFGLNYDYAEDLGVDSTTGDTWLTKVSIVLPAVDEAFLVIWVMTALATGQDGEVRLYNSTDAVVVTGPTKVDKNSGTEALFAAFAEVFNATGSPKTLELQYRSTVSAGGSDISVREARLGFWQVTT